MNKEKWLAQAIKYYKGQEYKEALLACENAIQLDSTYSKAYHGKGLIYTALQEYGLAVNSYQEACLLAPNDAKVHFDMAEQLYTLKDYERACIFYKRAIDIDNKYEKNILIERKVSLIGLIFYGRRLDILLKQ